MKKVLFFILVLSIVSINLLFAATKNFSLLKAIKLTLKHNNDILLQKENIKISEGDIKVSQSKFDLAVNPTINYTHTESPISESYQSQSNTISTGVNITKTFRIGISSAFRASTTRTDDIDSSKEPSNFTVIGFSLNIPLLEGLGRDAADADELASKNNLVVTKYNMAHTVSSSIYKTVYLYWNYLLSTKNLKEYKESLNRTEKILQQVEILIDKDVRPKADIEQILASVSAKKSAVFNREQDVVYAKNNLASFIGLEPEKFNKISLPVTDFPKIKSVDIEQIKKCFNKIILNALKSRYDYRALKQSEKTNKIMLTKAINKLKDRLDLNIDLSYKRLEQEKYTGAMLDSFWKERPGFNVNMILNYNWPVQNSYAKGLVLKYKSLLNQSVYNRNQLKRAIFANIKIELSNLIKSYNSLKADISAVNYYKKAIENERKKYKLGMSTILDVINIEDKLTNANLNKIAAYYNVAIAIVKLQYETGKLLKKNNSNFDFIYNNVVSIKNLLK